MFLERRGRKIVKGFRQLAAALRKKDPGSIELVRGLRSTGKRRMEFLLLSKLLGAGMAICKVRCDQLAFTLANFLANIKDQ